MIFEEYYEKYLNYKKIKSDLNNLENKKISIMSMVDIQGSSTETDKTTTNIKEDKFLRYVEELEETETRIDLKKKALEESKKQLEQKEEELRNSKEVLDKVYVLKYLEHLKYFQIANKINFGKTKTYSLINEIDSKINLVKIAFAEKNGKN